MFIDAVANPEIPGPATVHPMKTSSSVTRAAVECEICKPILSKAHEFEDNSPETKRELSFGPEKHDIKRVRLIYQGPVSEDADFATVFDQVIRNCSTYAAGYVSSSSSRTTSETSTADDPAARVVKTRPIEVAEGSSKSFNTAKSWLGKCYADHGDYSQLRMNVMPTRCLMVDNLDAIHLCMTQSQEHLHAAYRWGPKKNPNSIATKESFKLTLTNVPLMSFPLTLRDGIIVAHEVGLRYLWIDALCIIQDDDDDKNNEILQMRRIFSNTCRQSRSLQPWFSSYLRASIFSGPVYTPPWSGCWKGAHILKKKCTK